VLGLLSWYRNNEAGGATSVWPAGLWLIGFDEAAVIANVFDLVQLPPASLGWGGSAPGVDGYGVQNARCYDGTRYGNQKQLAAFCAALSKRGVQIMADLSLHQMDGENGGPGVFTYPGGVGNLTPADFQGGWGNNDPIPPFGARDIIPSTDGDSPDGRVRKFMDNPHGETDAKQILALLLKITDAKVVRWDEAKAMHVQSVRRIMDSQPIDFCVEYYDGYASNVLTYMLSEPMSARAGAEDIPWYWCVQRACNSYDATLFGGDGLWRHRPDLTFTFVNDPDVDTSRAPGGGISQQIAFNLLLGLIATMFLPSHVMLVDAKTYYPASSVRPGCYGLQPYVDNAAWFLRTFSFGDFEERWRDRDVWAYTRDGSGGALGWSGGMLVALNFNTSSSRTVTLQTMWHNQSVHNYAITGHAEGWWVGEDGNLTVTIPANVDSRGQSYLLIAPVTG
jgi:alpha-amylase